MKTRFLAFSLFTFAFSFVATATPSYWAAVETTAATGDTSGGANQDLYSTYCWTVAKAADLFKVDGTVDAVETYLANNFAAGRSALAASAGSGAAVEVVSADKAAQLTTDGYVDGLYGFRATYGDALSSSVLGSEYLALLFYENGNDLEFRLMTTTLENGNLHFSADPYETVGNPGAWQQAVPEPTSALLILLGMAGLALRRRRGVPSASENKAESPFSDAVRTPRLRVLQVSL